MIPTTYQQIEKYLLDNPGQYKTELEISRAVHGECVRHAFRRAMNDITHNGRVDEGINSIGIKTYRINQ